MVRQWTERFTSSIVLGGNLAVEEVLTSSINMSCDKHQEWIFSSRMDWPCGWRISIVNSAGSLYFYSWNDVFPQ